MQKINLNELWRYRMNKSKDSKGNQSLDIPRNGKQLYIRIPEIRSDKQYLSTIGELGRALSKEKHTSDVVVRVKRPSVPLTLAAVLFRLKNEIEKTGGSFEIVPDH
jgi:hypothetical protein